MEWNVGLVAPNQSGALAREQESALSHRPEWSNQFPIPCRRHSGELASTTRHPHHRADRPARVPTENDRTTANRQTTRGARTERIPAGRTRAIFEPLTHDL